MSKQYSAPTPAPKQQYTAPTPMTIQKQKESAPLQEYGSSTQSYNTTTYSSIKPSIAPAQEPIAVSRKNYSAIAHESKLNEEERMRKKFKIFFSIILTILKNLSEKLEDIKSLLHRERLE